MIWRPTAKRCRDAIRSFAALRVRVSTASGKRAICRIHFLNWYEFSAHYPDSVNILQVDNGRFHKSKNLVVPDNIILLFQPPYCPELNPIEHLWQALKADLKWAAFKTLEQLQAKIDQLLAKLTPEVIASITGYSFIREAVSALNTV